MPRFGAVANKPVPEIPADPTIEMLGTVANPVKLPLSRLDEVPRVEETADFHCVTTWTVPGLRWSGWRFADVWRQIIEPEAEPDPAASHVRVAGLDGYMGLLDLEDALQADVLLVDHLQGAPLDGLRGAPLRLISPSQYGYKSVKHVSSIKVYTSPPKTLGKLEHPRARVALEERHETVSGPLLRWPYRLSILPVAYIARRSARRG